MPSASTSTWGASASASGATPSENSDLAASRCESAMASPQRLSERITVVAETLDPPPIAASLAVLPKGTSAPQVTRKSRMDGLTRSPMGRPSASSSG